MFLWYCIKVCKLYKNLLNVKVLGGHYKNKSGWKHGIPNRRMSNSKNVLFVCIIRDLGEWLNSMYHRPYHIRKRGDFNKFITMKTINKDNSYPS